MSLAIAAAAGALTSSAIPEGISYMRPTFVGASRTGNPFTWSEVESVEGGRLQMQKQKHVLQRTGEMARMLRGHERLYMYRVVVYIPEVNGGRGVTLADARKKPMHDAVWSWCVLSLIPAAHALTQSTSLNLGSAVYELVEAIHDVLETPGERILPSLLRGYRRDDLDESEGSESGGGGELERSGYLPIALDSEWSTYPELMDKMSEVLVAARDSSELVDQLLAQNAIMGLVRDVLEDPDVVDHQTMNRADEHEIRNETARNAFNALYAIWWFKFELKGITERVFKGVDPADVMFSWIEACVFPVVMMTLSEKAAFWMGTMTHDVILTDALKRVLLGILVFGDESDHLLVPSIMYRIARVTTGLDLHYQSQLAQTVLDVLDRIQMAATAMPENRSGIVAAAEDHLLYLQHAVDIRRHALRRAQGTQGMTDVQPKATPPTQQPSVDASASSSSSSSASREVSSSSLAASAGLSNMSDPLSWASCTSKSPFWTRAFALSQTLELDAEFGAAFVRTETEGGSEGSSGAAVGEGGVGDVGASDVGGASGGSSDVGASGGAGGAPALASVPLAIERVPSLEAWLSKMDILLGTGVGSEDRIHRIESVAKSLARQEEEEGESHRMRLNESLRMLSSQEAYVRSQASALYARGHDGLSGAELKTLYGGHDAWAVEVILVAHSLLEEVETLRFAESAARELKNTLGDLDAIGTLVDSVTKAAGADGPLTRAFAYLLRAGNTVNAPVVAGALDLGAPSALAGAEQYTANAGVESDASTLLEYVALSLSPSDRGVFETIMHLHTLIRKGSVVRADIILNEAKLARVQLLQQVKQLSGIVPVIDQDLLRALEESVHFVLDWRKVVEPLRPVFGVGESVEMGLPLAEMARFQNALNRREEAAERRRSDMEMERRRVERDRRRSALQKAMAKRKAEATSPSD